MEDLTPQFVDTSFEVEFTLVDTITGEILTKNKRGTIVTESPEVPDLLNKWLACFYRGLRQNRSLAIQISSKHIQLPTQLEIF